MQRISYLALLVFGCTSVARAVPQLPTIDWEVSADGGGTWASDLTISSAQTIKIRSRLRWSGDGLGVKFVNFDVWITDPEIPSNIVRSLIPPGNTQQVVFTRLSETSGKIDVQGDSAAPGAGSQWVRIGQDTPANLGAAFNSSNPVELMSFDFTIPPGIEWRNFQIGSIQSGVLLQAVQIYVTATGGTTGGTFNRADVGVNACTVRFQPTADPPTITIHQQPVSQGVCFGQGATFNVVATTTAPPLQYRWLYPENIHVWIDGPSISSTGLYEPAPFVFVGGQFTCLVTDAAGTIASQTASISLNRADIDMNGYIDIDDYHLFVIEFLAGNAAADWNLDQSIDIFDYLEFLDRFNAGC